MRSIQMVVTSAGISFRRRLNNPKTYLALAVMAIFSFYIFSPVCELASYYQLSCPPWLFPFFMSFPIMLMVHGGLCLLLFSDGGENDGYSYLMLARCGRKAIMIGRLLEVLFTSFLYTLTLLVFSVVFILPVLGWDSDWGTLLRTLAESSGIMAEQTGVSLSFVVSPECIALFTPFQAVGFPSSACGFPRRLLGCSSPFAGFIGRSPWGSLWRDFSCALPCSLCTWG